MVTLAAELDALLRWSALPPPQRRLEVTAWRAWCEAERGAGRVVSKPPPDAAAHSATTRVRLAMKEMEPALRAQFRSLSDFEGRLDDAIQTVLLRLVRPAAAVLLVTSHPSGWEENVARGFLRTALMNELRSSIRKDKGRGASITGDGRVEGKDPDGPGIELEATPPDPLIQQLAEAAAVVVDRIFPAYAEGRPDPRTAQDRLALAWRLREAGTELRAHVAGVNPTLSGPALDTLVDTTNRQLTRERVAFLRWLDALFPPPPVGVAPEDWQFARTLASAGVWLHAPPKRVVSGPTSPRVSLSSENQSP